MLGAIESLLSAVVADGMSGTKHESNTELFGQGLANIFAPLFGGIASQVLLRELLQIFDKVVILRWQVLFMPLH